jgi:hypothetical protein
MADDGAEEHRMQDQPPPNEPRVLLDAQIEVRQGQAVPVLAQPSTQRLIVLNSTILNQLEIGQSIMLQVPEQDPLSIVIESIDRSSLIVRYIGAS